MHKLSTFCAAVRHLVREQGGLRLRTGGLAAGNGGLYFLAHAQCRWLGSEAMCLTRRGAGECQVDVT